MGGVIIVVVIIIMAVAIYFSLQTHKKLVAEGKIVSRSKNFMENAEEFTLVAVEPEKVTEAIKALNYNEMRTQMQGSSEQQLFKFTGNGWNAQLHRLEDNGTQVVYRFEFTHWKTHNGMAQDMMNMNKLLTAVEKMFLGFDSNTQVRSVALELKTKRSFL